MSRPVSVLTLTGIVLYYTNNGGGYLADIEPYFRLASILISSNNALWARMLVCMCVYIILLIFLIVHYSSASVTGRI